MSTIKLTESSTNPSSNLRRECVDEIKNELYGNFVELAPRELNILSDIAVNVECQIVLLGATRDLLDRVGFSPIDRHEIVKH